MSTTLATLIREVARDMFPENYLEGTALDTSTTTSLTANELHDDEANALLYRGGWVYIYAGTAVEDYRRIASYTAEATATTGSLAPTRPFSSAPTSTSSFIAYTGALSPDDIKRYLNKALRRMRRERFLPYTLVTDGLMEQSGTTNWVGSSATVAKVTSAATVYEGGRALQVTNTGATGYAYSVNVPVVPGQTLALAAAGRVTTTSGTATARVRLWDVTNGASIDTETFTARSQVLALMTGMTVPSGCFEVQVRLGADETAIVTAWDMVLLWRQNDRQFALPSDVGSRESVAGVWTMTPQQASPLGGRLYEARSMRPFLQPRTHWDILADPMGVTPYLLDLSRGTTPQWPFGVQAYLPWDELSAYTDTTNANMDDLNIYARALGFAYLAEAGPRDDRRYYKEQAQTLAIKVFHHAARQPRPVRAVGRRT